MRKIIIVFSILMLSLGLAACDKKSEYEKVTDTDTETSNTITKEGNINPQGGVTVGDDIINENARYTYFYSKTCGHCQNLNKYLEEHQMYDKVPMEKLELNENTSNRQRFLILTSELGDQGAGVPFVYDNVEKKYVVGVDDAIAMFESYTPDTTSVDKKLDTTKADNTQLNTEENQK